MKARFAFAFLAPLVHAEFMKSLISLIVTLNLLSSCSTSTEKANAIRRTENVATVIGGGIPTYSAVNHQVEVDGFAISGSDKFVDFKTLQVHFMDDGKIVATADIDGSGHFSKNFSSRSGDHVVELVRKADNSQIAKKPFSTNEKMDKVNININF